jgi:hypothetical protein
MTDLPEIVYSEQCIQINVYREHITAKPQPRCAEETSTQSVIVREIPSNMSTVMSSTRDVAKEASHLVVIR